MDECKRKWEWDAAVCGHVHYKWHVMWTQWSLCEVSVSIVISYIGPGLFSRTPQHLDHGGSRRRHSIAWSRSTDSKVRQSDSASMFLCHFHLLDRGSGALRQMRPYVWFRDQLSVFSCFNFLVLEIRSKSTSFFKKSFINVSNHFMELIMIDWCQILN